MIEPIATWVRGTPVSVVDESRLDVPVAGGMFTTVLVDQSSFEVFRLVTGWPAPSVFTRPDPAVTLEHMARTAAIARSGLLECEAREGSIAIRMVVYREGLSRHSFMNALGEVSRAYQFLDQAADDIEAQVALLDEVRAAATGPAVVAASGGWSATHVVGASGADAWDGAAEAGRPVVHLPPGMEVSARPGPGGRVQVVSSSGWTGWVDAGSLTVRP